MDFLQYALDALNEIERKRNQVVYMPPDSIPESEYNTSNYGIWLAKEKIEYPKHISLSQARTEIAERLKNHITSDYDVLLLAAPAGVGKTYAGVTLAQDLARQGKRVFWASPAHYLYNDLSNMPHFDDSLWYHWQSMAGKIDNQDACIEYDSQVEWLANGYPSFALCKSLCMENGHFFQCGYRNQRHTKKPIIFGMHNHLTLGLPIENFDVFIIDELPLSEFINEQTISVSKMFISGMPELTKNLINRMITICNTTNRIVHSNELMEEILNWFEPLAPYLENKNLDEIKPRIPDTSELGNLKPFYIMPMLVELYREYLAYCDGRQYEGRIQLSSNGVRILRKSELWKNLPRKGYIFDATGNKEIYSHLLPNRTMDTYKPYIDRIGNVYQITKRLNAKTHLTYTDNKTNRNLQKAKQDIDLIIKDKGYTDIGIITHLTAKPYFEKFYNPDRILHFYNQRGTNTLIGIDALFVIGAPSPDYDTIYKIAQVINENLEPIQNTQYSYKSVSYKIDEKLYSEIGATYLKNVGGYWGNELLQTIHNQYRESELIQSINRARPLSQNVDIWLLTNIPTDAIIDRIYENTPIGASYNNAYPMAQYWQDIKPLLNRDRITYQDLANVSNLSVRTIQRRNWFEAIENSFKDWKIDTIPTLGRHEKVLTKHDYIGQ